jgi:hypothetical protein
MTAEQPIRQLMYAILCTRWKKPALYQGMWYMKTRCDRNALQDKDKTWKQALKDGDKCVRIMVEVSLL